MHGLSPREGPLKSYFNLFKSTMSLLWWGLNCIQNLLSLVWNGIWTLLSVYENCFHLQLTLKEKSSATFVEKDFLNILHLKITLISTLEKDLTCAVFVELILQVWEIGVCMNALFIWDITDTLVRKTNFTNNIIVILGPGSNPQMDCPLFRIQPLAQVLI